jgi:hypothetical protein
MAMSAANAVDDNRVAAPAAREITLRIDFVLLSGEADCKKGPTKNSRADDAIKCLSGA